MEIRGPNPNINQPDPNQVGGASPTGKTEKTSFSETLGTGAAGPAGGAAPSSGAGQAGPLTSAAFGKLQSRIQEGVAAGQPKQQILESLIGEQLTEQFGGKASPQMTAAVADLFQTDPQLSQVFNRLYSQATKA